MGFCYAKGLRRQSGETVRLGREGGGAFTSAENLTMRLPQLNRKELTLLARIGALNTLDGIEHRRDSLWQVERAGKLEGPLFRQTSNLLADSTETLPLLKMSTEERLVADYAGTGHTVDRHPMCYRRAELRREQIVTAQELRSMEDGAYVRTAGCVIDRQRPGTARGFIFLSIEDETGIANIIVTPELYERDQLTVTHSKSKGSCRNRMG